MDIECSFPKISSCLVKHPINATSVNIVNILPTPNASEIDRFALDAEYQFQLDIIPKVIFEKFPSLHHVELNNAGIKSLAKDHFENSTKLTTLYLRCNKLRIITAEVFSLIPNLKGLDLSQNEIDDIENFGLKNLNNLRYLKLDHNRIRVLNKFALTDAVNLKYLNIQSNELEVIEDGALNLPHLFEVIFRLNKLKILSDNLFAQTPNINYVDFGYNQITHIGQAFYQCREIHALSLEGNPIQDINLMMFANMEALAKLSLNDTNLALPTDLPNIDKANAKSMLASLYLSNNHLSSENVFEHLSMFRQLHVLLLNNNDFNHLPDVSEIKHLLPELTYINLVNNVQICEWYRKHKKIFEENDIRITVGDCAYS